MIITSKYVAFLCYFRIKIYIKCERVVKTMQTNVIKKNYFGVEYFVLKKLPNETLVYDRDFQ
jgi:hypothetical protein